ncbi:MAG: hypothetical protein AAF333_09520, partial [Planctomycetota bacterium]
EFYDLAAEMVPEDRLGELLGLYPLENYADPAATRIAGSRLTCDTGGPGNGPSADRLFGVAGRAGGAEGLAAGSHSRGLAGVAPGLSPVPPQACSNSAPTHSPKKIAIHRMALV